jgi:hypothetical protein
MPPHGRRRLIFRAIVTWRKEPYLQRGLTRGVTITVVGSDQPAVDQGKLRVLHERITLLPQLRATIGSFPMLRLAAR